MGTEYVEYRIKLRNKRTDGKILVHTQLLHEKGSPLYKKEDFEVTDMDVVYG